MPRIIDNINIKLEDFLRTTLAPCTCADMCVGYFNLRGWKLIDDLVDRWTGEEGACARVMVGMQAMPYQQLKRAYSLRRREDEDEMSQGDVVRLKNDIVRSFATQLGIGAPSQEDEQGLRRLAAQLRARKLVVKLFLRHNLHAKLYLLHRPDTVSPIVGLVGSSNLTMAGLASQGELNVDVVEGDAANKLQAWFDALWDDRWCLDITDELAEIIEESWARTDLVPPYHIYLKIAYHLSNEARTGIRDYRIPKVFEDILFDYQKAAVKIAAHHLYKRNGAIIGDVVGLGKTLLAMAVAKLFQTEFGDSTLILCPPKLVPMWQDHVDAYQLSARVIPISQVQKELPELRPFRLVIIDESHNLRNRESKRYRAIWEYLNSFNTRVLLLSATPYNKSYLDLSAQLRLFVNDEEDLGIRPEALLRTIPEHEFAARYQTTTKCLRAFEKSEFPDDWRELMRLFLIRRTRSFIKNNYATFDPVRQRHFLELHDGTPRYFPIRQPRTVKFAINDQDPNDQYARLYAQDVVDTINGLSLPRYGLGNYINDDPKHPPSNDDARIIQNLSRAGKRLMGFCRTNLFKRLESSGIAFLMSLDRHILRNHIFLYALENDLEVPIGTQDSGILDPSFTDQDEAGMFSDEDNRDQGDDSDASSTLRSEADYRRRAAEAYRLYSTQFRRRFQWLDASHFKATRQKNLGKDLKKDIDALRGILSKVGEWNPDADTKLEALVDLAMNKHPEEKILLFSQFADTVRYLNAELTRRGVDAVEMATGDTDDPTRIAKHFSPKSNTTGGHPVVLRPGEEIRVLLATDVLSEGQNLQDAHIVLNWDLPWAIIRLIQRAGRVDRIGQENDDLLAYTFLPAQGVEKIIRLRSRLSQRLHDNAEVVGTDEEFFDDEKASGTLRDLYHEKAGILDGEEDDEVDLSSYALQIWKNATDDNAALRKKIEELPNLVYSARAHKPSEAEPEGAIAYVRTQDGNDALIWTDNKGATVTESQFTILKAVECKPDTPAIPHAPWHHDVVTKGAQHVLHEQRNTAGSLGSSKSARYRVYTRLSGYLDAIKDELFATTDLKKTVQDIYEHPLRQSAVDTLNRLLKMGVSDQDLADCAVELNNDDKLCIREEDQGEAFEPVIICSMGLVHTEETNP